MERHELRKMKKKKRRRRILLVIVLLFVIVISFGAYSILKTYKAASESYDDLGREKSDLRENPVNISEHPVSILLMGVENYSSGGDNGRSDTLMVATFNPDDKKLKLLSIPRDTMVEIAGKDTKDKITHAYSYGGKEMTIETVENFLDIPIDYYAAVNFNAFKNIVNILDGITVDVPFDFTQNSDDRVAEKLQFNEGEMHLNGRYALAFARMRLQDPRGDIGRNARQQQVVKAIINKTMSLSTITKIDNLAEEIGKNVETNMKISEALGFYKQYSDFGVSNIDKLVLETYPERIDGLYYEIPNSESLKEVKETLSEHLELEKYTLEENDSSTAEEAGSDSLKTNTITE